MNKTNFERLVETLFQLPKKRGTFRFPYVDHSVHPPEEKSFSVKLTELDAHDILTIVKRAANKQCIERGEKILFTNPVDYPDPEAEIRRRFNKFISAMLVEAEDLDDSGEKRKLLREIRMANKEARPDISMKKYEWDRLVKAFKKVNSSLTEDEILSALD